MIGTHDFAAANARRRETPQGWSPHLPEPRVLKLNALRSEGIWPMK